MPPEQSRSVGVKTRLTLCLIHDGAQPGPPAPDPVQFGLQDTSGEVHPSSGLTKDGKYRFEFLLDVKASPAGTPIFTGPYCQGPPSSRFVYLSWKRTGQHAAPWAWRIKVPLNGIDWNLIAKAEKPDHSLEADVSDLRPHAKAAIVWDVVRR